MKLKKLILTIFIIGIVGVIGFAFYILQTQTFSKDEVFLEILAPDKVEAGEQINFIVKLENRGTTRLDDAVLTFLYPENSIVEGNEFLRETINLDSLYPGEEKSFTFVARIFGKENDFKEAKAILRYKPKNLNSEFESSTSHLLQIERVPINLSINMPSAIEPPAKIKLNIDYLSNIDLPLEDVTIFLEYPSGFEFLSSEPSSIEINQWDIPKLEDSEGGRIIVEGNILGDIGEEKEFKAKIGIWRNGQFVVLKEAVKKIVLEKVDLIISQTVNSQEDYIAEPGELLHYVIKFKNIGEKDLSNLFMVVNLDTQTLDLPTLKVINGKYNNKDNFILYDNSSSPLFSLLKSGEEGEVEFFVNVKDIESLKPANDIVVLNSVFISKIREEFQTKIKSKPIFTTKLAYEDEIFGNTGPNPPQVQKETTYTIIWNIKNKINSLKDIRITAVLPEIVSVNTDNIFPEQEKQNFVLDEEDRKISFTIEEMSPNEEKSIAFQVKVLPQKEEDISNLIILKDIKLSAFDEWIQDNIEYAFKDLTIPTQNDNNEGQNNNNN